MAAVTGSLRPYDSIVLLDIAKLMPHEETIDENVLSLVEAISRNRYVAPIVVDAKTCTILDGHHRTKALMLLGYPRVPALAVDYDDNRIRVEAWRNGARISKEKVIEHALEKRLFPPKTSRHILEHCIGGRMTKEAKVAVEQLA